MKKIIITTIALALPFVLQAQSNQALRDSLKKATEQLSYYPDSIDLRLKKAAWNIQLEQWEYAKDDLDKVLFLDNSNLAGLYYRGYVNMRMGRYNFGRMDYTNLLTIVPNNFEAKLGLALLNQKDKHFTEALDQINILVTQFPDSAIAYAARAGIEKERGFLELSLSDYEEAIKRDPNNKDYLLNHVDILLTLGRKREAEADIKRLERMGISRRSILK